MFLFTPASLLGFLSLAIKKIWTNPSDFPSSGTHLVGTRIAYLSITCLPLLLRKPDGKVQNKKASQTPGKEGQSQQGGHSFEGFPSGYYFDFVMSS